MGMAHYSPLEGESKSLILVGGLRTARIINPPTLTLTLKGGEGNMYDQFHIKSELLSYTKQIFMIKYTSEV